MQEYDTNIEMYICTECLRILVHFYIAPGPESVPGPWSALALGQAPGSASATRSALDLGLAPALGSATRSAPDLGSAPGPGPT